MTKRSRQYIGIIFSVIAYYIIHEGAHFICALCMHCFKNINIMAMGVQVDIYRERITDTQLGIFCLVGALATLFVCILLIVNINKICSVKSKVIRSTCYYLTIVMMLLDPLYLSILCSFFGGGDMNGIQLLIPQMIARVLFFIVLIMNGLIFYKIVLPTYTKSFQQ